MMLTRSHVADVPSHQSIIIMDRPLHLQRTLCKFAFFGLHAELLSAVLSAYAFGRSVSSLCIVNTMHYN